MAVASSVTAVAPEPSGTVAGSSRSALLPTSAQPKMPESAPSHLDEMKAQMLADAGIDIESYERSERVELVQPTAVTPAQSHTVGGGGRAPSHLNLTKAQLLTAADNAGNGVDHDRPPPAVISRALDASVASIKEELLRDATETPTVDGYRPPHAASSTAALPPPVDDAAKEDLSLTLQDKSDEDHNAPSMQGRVPSMHGRVPSMYGRVPSMYGAAAPLAETANATALASLDLGPSSSRPRLIAGDVHSADDVSDSSCGAASKSSPGVVRPASADRPTKTALVKEKKPVISATSEGRLFTLSDKDESHASGGHHAAASLPSSHSPNRRSGPNAYGYDKDKDQFADTRAKLDTSLHSADIVGGETQSSSSPTISAVPAATAALAAGPTPGPGADINAEDGAFSDAPAKLAGQLNQRHSSPRRSASGPPTLAAMWSNPAVNTTTAVIPVVRFPDDGGAPVLDTPVIQGGLAYETDESSDESSSADLSVDNFDDMPPLTPRVAPSYAPVNRTDVAAAAPAPVRRLAVPHTGAMIAQAPDHEDAWSSESEALTFTSVEGRSPSVTPGVSPEPPVLAGRPSLSSLSRSNMHNLPRKAGWTLDHARGAMMEHREDAEDAPPSPLPAESETDSSYMDSYDGAEEAPSPEPEVAPALGASALLAHSMESTSSAGGYTPNFSAIRGKRAGFKASPVGRR